MNFNVTMITTMSDSTDVGCAIATAAKAAVRSSVPGVQAGTRGAKEGELGPRLQQQRQGSGVVSCADIKARNCRRSEVNLD